MLTGLCAGHGKFELQAISVPVEVCGMQVCPNDIIHMDENGQSNSPRISRRCSRACKKTF